VNAGPLDVVCPGAHPDDVEIGCGGCTASAGGFQVSSSPGNVLAKLPLADPQQRCSSRSRPHAPAIIHKPGLTLLRR
jgi:hypothetical protein